MLYDSWWSWMTLGIFFVSRIYYTIYTEPKSTHIAHDSSRVVEYLSEDSFLLKALIWFVLINQILCFKFQILLDQSIIAKHICICFWFQEEWRTAHPSSNWCESNIEIHALSTFITSIPTFITTFITSISKTTLG